MKGKKAVLEKLTRKEAAKAEVRKLGFKEGLKRSFKIFGSSASQVFGSLGSATGQVLGDGSAAKDKKFVKGQVKKEINVGKQDLFGSIDSVIKGLPD